MAAISMLRLGSTLVKQQRNHLVALWGSKMTTMLCTRDHGRVVGACIVVLVNLFDSNCIKSSSLRMATALFSIIAAVLGGTVFVSIHHV